MANTIQLKRSAVPAKTPTTSDLALGEIGINTYDGKMYIKKDNGTPSVVEVGAAELPSQTGNGGKYLTTNGSAASWATISGGSPGGSTGQLQYNNAGALGGASKVSISGGTDLELLPSSTPPTPSTDKSIVVFKDDRAYPSVSVRHNSLGIGDNKDAVFQLSVASKDIGWWNPPGNATIVPGVLGINAPTATGTVTARIVAAAGVVDRMRRLGYVSAATAGSRCGQSWTVRQWTFGTGTGLGGFYMVYRFAVSDGAYSLTGSKWTWVGMTTQSGPLTSLPTTYCFGLFQPADSTTTNWMMRCAGGNLGTDINLGSNFPINTTDAYEVRLYSSPNDSYAVHYEVIRLGTGHTATGSFNTASLAWSTSTLLAPQALRSNGTSTHVVGIDIASLYIENTV